MQEHIQERILDSSLVLEIMLRTMQEITPEHMQITLPEIMLELQHILGNYQGFFTGFYTGYFAGSRTYSGNYVGNYSGTYSGTYSGATVIETKETVSTVKLWVRTA